MSLDDAYKNQAELKREALERDRQRDWAERLHELELRDEAESIEAEESHWRSTFVLATKHWTARQRWDGTT